MQEAKGPRLRGDDHSGAPRSRVAEFSRAGCAAGILGGPAAAESHLCSLRPQSPRRGARPRHWNSTVPEAAGAQGDSKVVQAPSPDLTASRAFAPMQAVNSPVAHTHLDIPGASSQ